MTTEQQTAATASHPRDANDNALLEPVAWIVSHPKHFKELSFQPLMAADKADGWTETPLYGPEAAERIKSLLAEVATVTSERDSAMALLEPAYERNRELLADRETLRVDLQRMRDALEAIADDPFSDIEGVRIFARQAINPATSSKAAINKEANDG